MEFANIETISSNLNKRGICDFSKRLIDRLKYDYLRINDFNLHPRVGHHCDQGVIEVMPIADWQHYACKWVNGHPGNPRCGLPAIMATGLLANMKTGQPLWMGDMTLITAIRTACTSALFLSVLKLKKPISVGLIGLGSQADFHLMALSQVSNIKQVFGFDLDQSMHAKIQNNLEHSPLNYRPVNELSECMHQVDVWVTLTASKKRNDVFQGNLPKTGAIIVAVGGDCPGKSELSPELLNQATVVVPFKAQADIEGEVQYDHSIHSIALSEFISRPQWSGKHLVFDSIGIALEDFSAMMVYWQEFGNKSDSYLSMKHPKNLWGSLGLQWS